MTEADSEANRAYTALRDMAANFTFRPEERLNEGALSRDLGVSRTPLREALNRLVAEGFLVAQPGRGVFCRPLSPARIVDLYEARAAVEAEAARRACQRADRPDIEALAAYLDETATDYADDAPPARLLAIDEAFHLRLTGLSGNAELEAMLRNLNGRIRFVRLVNFNMICEAGIGGPAAGLAAHRAIVGAVLQREEDRAAALTRAHIERRREETVQLVRQAFSAIYVDASR